MKGNHVTAKTKRKIRFCGRMLFIIYILSLVYFLFFFEGYGRMDNYQGSYHYNLVLFKEIKRFWIHREKVGMTAALLNIAGNVVGFVPFGFILPVMHRRFKNFWLVGILGFSLSLTVETMQLIFRVGCFDVDDLVLNTCGAVLGYLVFAVCNKWRTHYGKKI